jgi:hypothetical protein
MRRMSRGLMFLAFGPLFIVLFAVFVFLVMTLWNWLMPEVLGLRAITYWQALGILVLSKILFGGFPGGGRHRGPRWRHRMRERWEHMTPEEREKFRQGMWGRWTPHGTAEEPKP